MYVRGIQSSVCIHSKETKINVRMSTYDTDKFTVYVKFAVPDYIERKIKVFFH